MATHSSILAWKVPWTEEPGGLQSTGSKRARHDLVMKKQQNNKVLSSGMCPCHPYGEGESRGTHRTEIWTLSFSTRKPPQYWNCSPVTTEPSPLNDPLCVCVHLCPCSFWIRVCACACLPLAEHICVHFAPLVHALAPPSFCCLLTCPCVPIRVVVWLLQPGRSPESTLTMVKGGSRGACQHHSLLTA